MSTDDHSNHANCERDCPRTTPPGPASEPARFADGAAEYQRANPEPPAAPPSEPDSANRVQARPTPGHGAAIWDLVIADARERDAMGTAKYGQRLQAGDGRDHLVDAYQEALDLAVYLRQEIEERKQTTPTTAPEEDRTVHPLIEVHGDDHHGWGWDPAESTQMPCCWTRAEAETQARAFVDAITAPLRARVEHWRGQYTEQHRRTAALRARVAELEADKKTALAWLDEARAERDAAEDDARLSRSLADRAEADAKQARELLAQVEPAVKSALTLQRGRKLDTLLTNIRRALGAAKGDTDGNE